MAGRPRKPHHIRLLEGGRGHSRPLTPDLEAPADPLARPAGLAADERLAWDSHVERIRALGLESSVDAGAVEAMVSAYCLARRARLIVRKKGLTVVTPMGIKARPEVAIARDAWRAYVQACGKFGLEPSARAKLPPKKKEPEKAGDVPAGLRDASAG
jgi:P27 family predicted phage terminase small subunit